MTAGMVMVHRATIRRNANAGAFDAYNNPLDPNWLTHLSGQPCYYYEPRVGQTGERIGQENAVMYAHAALVPLSTDIREGDQITGIVDRRGETVTDRTLRVDQVIRRRFHRLLVLEVVA